MTCPACGRDIRQGARFCDACGTSLERALCPACGHHLRPGVSAHLSFGGRLLSLESRPHETVCEQLAHHWGQSDQPTEALSYLLAGAVLSPNVDMSRRLAYGKVAGSEAAR